MIKTTSIEYQGGIENWDGKCIRGWVYSTQEPDAQLRLDVVVNNECVETIEAGTYREDLFLAGKGSGKHAFSSGDLTRHLHSGSSLDVIQIFLSKTKTAIHRPVFVREGNEITLKCFFPWTTLNVSSNGEVFPCISRSWFKEDCGLVGNNHEQTLDEVWSGPLIQRVRRNFANGNYGICREDVCPYLNGEFAPKPPSPSVIAAMRRPDEPFTSGIEELVHDIDQGCNLTCVMCRSNVIKPDVALGQKVANEIEKMAEKGDLKELRFSPGGEVLMHQGIVRLLKSRALSDKGVRVTVITNLTSIAPSLWNSIKHNNLSIQASLDGATRETYETIRRGAQWDSVYRNLLFLVDAYKKGELGKLTVCTVVMGRNRRDLGALIEMTKVLGINLFFIKHEGMSDLEENAFDCCRIDVLDEIYEQLERNHAFDLPHVHFGSAVILIDRKYRSFQFRMTCAELQLSRYGRHDIATRIINECFAAVESGELLLDDNQLRRLESFMTNRLTHDDHRTPGFVTNTNIFGLSKLKWCRG